MVFGMFRFINFKIVVEPDTCLDDKRLGLGPVQEQDRAHIGLGQHQGSFQGDMEDLSRVHSHITKV